MKSITIILFITILSGLTHAATQKSSVAQNSDTIQTSNEKLVLTENSSNINEPTAHISTAINNLVTGQMNINAKFFATSSFAFSLSYLTKSEKTTPIVKNNFADGSKININTDQTTIGGAYYFLNTLESKNFILNPFLVFQKKSDVLDTENSSGMGLQAEALMRVKHLALTGGLLYTQIQGDSNSALIVSAGYIF